MDSGTAAFMLQMIFQKVTVGTLVRGDRLLVYRIFEYLLERRLEDVKVLGSEFILGFIEAVNAEADPRNLVCVFKLFRQVTKHFELGVLAEDLFEAVACYFPIDFSPPSDNPDSITKEQLVANLEECFAASPLFAKFCLPLLLEKLESNVSGSKADSLSALIACCPVYDAKSVAEHSCAFWYLIRNEVFSNRKELEIQHLEALTALTQSISKDLIHLEDFLTTVYQDCLKYLEESEQKIFQQTSKLLVSVCKASAESSCRVLNTTIPIVLRELKLSSQMTCRQNLMQLVLDLIEAVRTCDMSSEDGNPMSAHKDNIYEVFVSMLTNPSPSLRKTSVFGLARLISLHSVLSEDERCQIAIYLFKLTCIEQDAIVRQECISSLTCLATDFPSVISSVVLPDLLRKLLERNATEEETSACRFSVLIDLLVGVSVGTEIVRQAVPVCVELLNGFTERLSDDSIRADAVQCISGLNAIVSSNLASVECLEFFLQWLLIQCEVLLLRCCQFDDGELYFHRTEDFILGVSRIVRHIIQKLPSSLAESFVSNITKLFLHGDVQHLSSYRDAIQFKVLPLQPEVSAKDFGIVNLLVAAICSVQNQDIVPEIDELMHRLNAIAVSCPDDKVSTLAAKGLAGLVNKANQDNLESFLQKLEWNVSRLLDEDSDAELSSKKKAVILWSWLTKALVLCNNKHQTTFVNQLVDLLGSRLLAEVSADGFRIVVSDFEDILCVESHVISTLMYRQRFFALSLGRLLDGYHANKETYSYLLAISYLIQNVPKQALVPDLPMLMPILVQSLAFEDERLWTPALQTIADLLCTAQDIISQFVDDMLPHLLLITRYKPKMGVRISALSCIHLICLKLPRHKILPNLDAVLRQLRLAMDDDKRAVRKKAAETRIDWSMLGMREN